MTAIRSQHSRVLERLIKLHRDDVMVSLADGHPQDYATYKMVVGRLQGLDNALRLSEQADFELSGDEPDGSP